MSSILKINSLSKSYKGENVLDNLSMNIDSKDIYGIIGKNGSGRSTLFRIITGLTNYNNGDFELLGISSKSKKIVSVRKRIRALIDEPNLNLNQTIYFNMKLYGILLGIKKDKEIEEALDLVGLYKAFKSKKLLKDYSVEIHCRLRLAMALLGKPEFVILDEPTKGLDLEGKKALGNIISDLNKKLNVTFLISASKIDDLFESTTKYGFLSNGTVKEITCEELDKNYHNKINYKFEGLVTNEVLEVLKSNNIVVNDNYIVAFDNYLTKNLLDFLKENNINITSMNETPKLEAFYMEIMGGKK